MRLHIIAILILISLLSGCITIEDTTVLYVTANITNNGTDLYLEDGIIDMERVFPLKMPKRDQTAKPPYMALQTYSNRDRISYISATEYHGNGSYTFTIPLKDGKIPHHNDTMAFEIRVFNGSAEIFNRIYFYARWRWDENE